MGTVAPQILDEHIGAVGFEGHTICEGLADLPHSLELLTISVVDHRVLDDDVGASIRIPA